MKESQDKIMELMNYVDAVSTFIVLNQCWSLTNRYIVIEISLRFFRFIRQLKRESHWFLFLFGMKRMKLT